MRRNIFLISVFLIFGLSASSQKTQLLHFYVEAGAYQRINTPVCLNLEGINISDTLSYELFEKVKGKMIQKPFQIETGYVPVLWWILDGTTKDGTKKEWIIEPGNLYRLKYRLLVYDGKIDKATAERLWNDFAYPPLVTVSKK